MKGHGEKLSRKEELAIVALLTRPTVAEAAQACGVSEVTLWRWMQQDAFREHYRQARRTALEGAIATLQQASGEAVATLRRNLTCGLASVEVRAALGILEQAIKGAELLDQAERIASLEAQVAAQAAAQEQADGRPAWRRSTGG